VRTVQNPYAMRTYNRRYDNRRPSSCPKPPIFLASKST